MFVLYIILAHVLLFNLTCNILYTLLIQCIVSPYTYQIGLLERLMSLILFLSFSLLQFVRKEWHTVPFPMRWSASNTHLCSSLHPLPCFADFPVLPTPTLDVSDLQRRQSGWCPSSLCAPELHQPRSSSSQGVCCGGQTLLCGKTLAQELPVGSLWSVHFLILPISCCVSYLLSLFSLWFLSSVSRQEDHLLQQPSGVKTRVKFWSHRCE